MNGGDPFSQGWERPSPGGRGWGDAPDAAPPSISIGAEFRVPDLERDSGTLFKDNPVVAAALPLLSLVSELRNSPSHPDIPGLQQRLVGEINALRNTLLRHGVGQGHTDMASYALCALLDETIQHTPWGARSFWGRQSLLSLFYAQTLGGEQFFPMVDGLVQQESQNIYLIELCHLCLSLGFQGQYRLMANCLGELDRYRNRLYDAIQKVRSHYERDLSPRWQGLRENRGALMRTLPPWVAAAVAGAVLVLAYVAFLIALAAASNPPYAALAALSGDPIKMAAPLPQAVPKPPGRAERFTALLRDEIRKGMVEVVDDQLLRVRNSFPSGSDQIKQDFVPMLKKVAGELNAKDTVLVSGHTDDRPIHNARFPSNWDLSIARARHVADILMAAGVDIGKVASRGSAEGDPLVANDSDEHRAYNRRVDISIR